MAVCMCGQIAEMYPVLIHDLSGRQQRLVRVRLCLACLRRTGIWCEKHEMVRVCICDQAWPAGKQESLVMNVRRACYKCAFDNLRLIEPAEKQNWLALLGEKGRVENMKKLLPPDGAKLLDPLSEEDVTMYGLLFSKELVGMSLQGVVQELVNSLGQSGSAVLN